MTLPAEMDLLNAIAVSDSLIAALERRAGDVIADMTSSTFCDAAGCRAVVHAGRNARHLRSRLVAVIPDPAVRRIFQLTGADQDITICESLGDVPAVDLRAPN